MESRRYVLKLGGSLADILLDLLVILRTEDKELLIIPGGGIWANTIRRLDPPADAAHWMAILAMEQYGHHIASSGIPPVTTIDQVEQTSVLLPYCLLRREDPLPHSWDVTSDTIAAWVAWSLSLPLIVLKSVDGIISQGRLVDQVHAPLVTDTVDSAFLPFILEKGVATVILNGRRSDRVRRALSGDFSGGTRIMGRTEEL